MSAAAAELAQIALNAARLEQLEAAAEAALADGRHQDAAVVASRAGNLAWYQHPARFTSDRLEAVCFAIGRDLPGEAATQPRPAGTPERVLHVLTEAYATGGHTGLACRWIALDDTRTHRLVATGQDAAEAEALRARAPTAEVGPWLSTRLPVTDRAAALRELARGADLIVLHTHPHDVVPLVAFPPGLERAPIVVSNHADHCFWLGAGIADVVLDHRPFGSRLSATRRGVPADRCLLAPLPPSTKPAEADPAARAAFRAKLGVSPDTVVALTVGSPYKYAANGSRHLANVIAPVLAHTQRAIVIAVGPADGGAWRRARERSGQRIHAIGPVLGADALYALADVYLESYPCSGATCLAEAAAAGLPVLTYAPDPVEAAVLGTTPDDAFQRATTTADHRARLGTLLRSRQERAAWGDRARTWSREQQGVRAWRDAVEAAYARARTGGTRTPEPVIDPPAPDPDDLQVHALHARSGHCPTLEEARRLVAEWRLEARGRDGVRLLADRSRDRLAVAAPAARPAALAEALLELELLVDAGVAGAGAIGVEPAAVALAADVLGPLVEERPSLSIDLLATSDAAQLLADADRLPVRLDGDAWTDEDVEAALAGPPALTAV